MNLAKDLSKEPARSPRIRVGGYAILARMTDKGRASLNGTAGEYHFDCPVDNMLFGFKGVKGADVEPLLKLGASDEQIATWLDTHGTPKTPAEVKAWSDSVEAQRPYENPEHREWFAGECVRLGLKPETTTLFDYLEADDRASFKH
jgi:Domain of unknown function (DUF5069)